MIHMYAMRFCNKVLTCNIHKTPKLNLALTVPRSIKETPMSVHQLDLQDSPGQRTPGITIYSGISDDKQTALSTGVNAPNASSTCLEI